MLKLVSESLNSFIRNQDPKKTLGLGLISVEIACNSVEVDDNLNVIPNADSDYLFDIVKDNHIQYEIIKKDHYGTSIKFMGTKEQLLRLLILFDAYGRDINSLRYDLKNWAGDEDELINILY